VFLVFGLICSLGVFFIWRAVPETKGKTLEEIAKFWLSKPEGRG
jgi:Sugar (and other) transporter